MDYLGPQKIDCFRIQLTIVIDFFHSVLGQFNNKRRELCRESQKLQRIYTMVIMCPTCFSQPF